MGVENINFNHVHFIGSGGIGMSAIAEVLVELGYQVSGSDAKDSEVTRRLSAKGAEIQIGQRVENITQDIDIVVHSTAIKADNPEIVQAKALGLPILHRSEMLAFLTLASKAICVAGAHGKTTTSSMIALMMELAGLQPTIVVGGDIEQIGGNAKYGGGEYLVAEADESDGTFLRLNPWMTVVTNIEEDHLDHYKDLAEIKEAFSAFVALPGENGVGIFCLDCPDVRDIITSAKGQVITYGFQEAADIRAENWQQEDGLNKADIYRQGEHLGQLVLHVPGRHNMSNALAAVAAGLTVGLTFEQIAQGLVCFTGAKRRFQIIGEEKGVKVVDDYAHHPTEIQATLEAARSGHAGRIIAVFQPHRYSRTKFLAPAFAESFAYADKVILTEVYSAGENMTDGAPTEIILEQMPPEKDACIVKKEDINAWLLKEVQPGDLVLMLGAGNIWMNAAQLVEDLKNS